MAGEASKTDIRALLSTPEAQAAIREIAAAQLAEMKKQNPGVGNDTEKLFSEMALAIAEMNHQGSGRARPLAPEIMAKRDAAAKQLKELLGEVGRQTKLARDTGDKRLADKWTPRYRVTGKIYFNETLVEPFAKPERRGDGPVANTIVWTGPPNSSLMPINDIALKIKTLFRESVGMPVDLEPRSGPNGGQAALDRRPYWMTVEGRVVQGSPPTGAAVLETGADLELTTERDSVDPNAPFVHVLGTVAQPARQGAQANQPPSAADLARM